MTAPLTIEKPVTAMERWNAANRFVVTSDYFGFDEIFEGARSECETYVLRNDGYVQYRGRK